MIIYSDINLNPFIKINNINSIKFQYREDYMFDEEIENQTIMFIFSDYFRLYSKKNIQLILNLIDFVQKKNRVILVGDLFFGNYYYSNKIFLFPIH